MQAQRREPSWWLSHFTHPSLRPSPNALAPRRSNSQQWHARRASLHRCRRARREKGSPTWSMVRTGHLCDWQGGLPDVQGLPAARRHEASPVSCMCRSSATTSALAIARPHLVTCGRALALQLALDPRIGQGSYSRLAVSASAVPAAVGSLVRGESSPHRRHLH